MEKVVIYQGEIYCTECGQDLLELFQQVEDSGDSNEYPQVGFLSESDSIEYCPECGEVIPTALTEYGIKDVLDRFTNWQVTPDFAATILEHHRYIFDDLPIADPPTNQTIIRATLRPEDLIPTFVELLLEVNPWAVLETALIWGRMFTHEVVDILMVSLDEVAPEGFYFGAHPGDGSDFGYWRLD